LSERIADAAARFAAGGNRTMYLTADAALRVCRTAAQRELLVYRVEGGIWHHPGFEARLDAIWDSQIGAPVSAESVQQSNERLAMLIEQDPAGCDAFVVSMRLSRPTRT
jgi:hypothetical protein